MKYAGVRQNVTDFVKYARSDYMLSSRYLGFRVVRILKQSRK